MAEVLSVVDLFGVALCVVLTHQSQMCFQLLLIAIRVCLQEETFILNFIWDHLRLADRQQSGLGPQAGLDLCFTYCPYPVLSASFWPSLVTGY